MATLISVATGNFTSSSTWQTSDSTSQLDSEVSNTGLTTSFVASSNFTPGAITVDAIAVKIASRTASPAGTITIELYNSTGASSVSSVTCNVADIPQSIAISQGWIVFKLSSSVLLLAATNYQIRAKTSNSTQVNLYRDATANNWSRMLRTTTTAAPAASDRTIVAGEVVSAGSTNSFTITMDNTTTTSFGDMQCNAYSTLKYGIAASTNYYLKLAGNLTINSTAKFYIGSNTLSETVPSTSTAKLEFACTTNVEFGLELRTGGILETKGNAVTTKALLTADAAASATSLTTNVSTGWLSGDLIALAPTSRTFTDTESKTLTANASGTTLTINAISTAHSGSTGTQAELLNLTRNISIFSASSSNNSYLNIADSAVDMRYTAIYNMGSATTNKRGINIATALGSLYMYGMAIYSFTATSAVGFFSTPAAANNITFDNGVMYDCYTIMSIPTTSQTNIIINDSYFCKNSAGFAVTINDVGITVTNCNFSGGASGCFILVEAAIITGTYSNLVIHSSQSTNIDVQTIISGTISNITTWRGSSYGIRFINCSNIIIDNLASYGSATAGGQLQSSSDVEIINSTFYAGTTLTQPIGLETSTGGGRAYIVNTTFGSPTTHSTGDINVTSRIFFEIICDNVLLGSSTEVSNQTLMSENSFIGSSKHDQTTGLHKRFKQRGTIQVDTTIYNTASPSTRMTPNATSGTLKFKDSNKKFAIAAGATANLKVYIRKSSSGDGTAYTGNQPRLMLKRNYGLGVTTDTVLATMTAGTGTWEQISGTTPVASENGVFEVYVDCDGTVGWINVDDFSIT